MHNWKKSVSNPRLYRPKGCCLINQSMNHFVLTKVYTVVQANNLTIVNSLDQFKNISFIVPS